MFGLAGIVAAVLVSLLCPSRVPAQPAHAISVNVQDNLRRLIEEEDTDGDKKITIDDTFVPGAERGNRDFRVVGADGKRYEIEGIYPLSNLLQDLKRADEEGSDKIYPSRIFAEPVGRISDSIRQAYWKELTRWIDGQHLPQILRDQKVASDGNQYLYVPHTDEAAYKYFSAFAAQHAELKLRVLRLPEQVTPEYVKELDGKHGLLSLALRRGKNNEVESLPFVVPGGRFNEMYGWDSYFIALGLIADGYVDLAKSMVDNFVYEIRHYGKILNANRTYYLTRSQPPFLTSMALAVYEALPKNSETKAWLQDVLEAAIKEYTGVWMQGDHFVKEVGLNRYHGAGIGPPPEVEPGAFDHVYAPYARACRMDLPDFEQQYRSGELESVHTADCDGKKISQALDEHFIHDRCVRESGHDTTYRWRWGWDGKDCCADFVTVDLNSLLYKTELDIARTIDKEFGGTLKTREGGKVEASEVWQARARQRRALIRKYLWDPGSGMFFDYDVIRKKRHPYVSATTFYPLWAWYPDDPVTQLASPAEAARLLKAALPLLEMAGGVSASAEQSRGPVSAQRPPRQWDYPYGWAPHQILIWRGLLNYGFSDVAHRLTYRWLYTITRNAVDYSGTIPEKLDVVHRSLKLLVEYGNVGTQFQYITPGFGWTNASYQIGLASLPADMRARLNRLVPPEWIF